MNFSPSFSIENDEFIYLKKAYSIGSTSTNPKKPKIVIRQNDTIDNNLPRKKPLKNLKQQKLKKLKILKIILKLCSKKKPFLKEDKQKIISDKKIVEKTVEKKRN